LKNYNSIVGNLVLEAHRHGDTSFEPLVIGVTWPSLWKLSSWSVVPDAVVRGVSFPWISDAAEDIGQSVITFAIEDVLKARNGAGRTVPVTLIGHSFGAKVLMNAIKVAWDRGPGGPEPPMNALFNGSDRLILLEGAFEVRDLFDDRAGTLRTPFAGSAPRVTMTASAYDNAVSTAFWGWYAGDIRSFDQICRENPETWRYWDLGSPFGTRDLQVSPIGCQVAVSKGRYGFHLCKSDYTPGRPARPLGGNGFRYFDASELINCNEPFTGGDAHSDIYRAETARFLLDEMK
jgi:hypothetical protein